MDSIGLKELINEARAVPAFKGDGSYELCHFIQEVETLVRMAPDDATKAYIFRILITKLQGKAATSIRRLMHQTVTWEGVKSQLIKSFGVQETYLKLKEKADSIKFFTVSQYYNELLVVLDKLNLKYNLDSDKPIEFKPDNNESSILEKFLSKLPRSDSMFLRIKGVRTIEEAYHELMQTGLEQNSDVRENNLPKNKLHSARNQFNRISSHSSHNLRNSNNFRNYSDSRYNRDFRHNDNFRNFSNNGGYRNNNDFRNSDCYRNSNVVRNNDFRNNSGRFRNSGNYHQNNSPNRTLDNRNLSAPEPMVIDHAEIQENFHVQPRVVHYQ